MPTLFAAILADPATQPGRIPGLRTSTSAGEALPRHVGEKWRATFGSDILDGIGSTEMLHIFLSNRPGDIRYGTSGKPVVGTRPGSWMTRGSPPRTAKRGRSGPAEARRARITSTIASARFKSFKDPGPAPGIGTSAMRRVTSRTPAAPTT